MSTLRNKVNLIGHIGQKPEAKSLNGGYTVARFSLATNERFKNKEGEWQDKTQWHTICAWGKLAESIAKNVDKGYELVVEGRISNKQFESKTGEKRYSTEVELRDFVIINKKEQAK